MYVMYCYTPIGASATCSSSSFFSASASQPLVANAGGPRSCLTYVCVCMYVPMLTASICYM